MPPVPSLQLPAVDDAPLLRSPRTEEWRSSLYQKSSTTPEAQRVASLTASPRSIQLYSPRTHAEQLEVTGSELDDALEAAKHLRERLFLLSERARRDRAAFAAAMGSSDQEEHCPICMESISEPRECENKHTFCAECLRSYRRATHRSPRLLCPLCRVAMPEVLGPFAAGNFSLRLRPQQAQGPQQSQLRALHLSGSGTSDPPR